MDLQFWPGALVMVFVATDARTETRHRPQLSRDGAEVLMISISDLFATSGHISPAMFRVLLILGASSLDLSPVGGRFSAESGWFAELWRRRTIRITTGLAERARLRWRAAGYRDSRALSN